MKPPEEMTDEELRIEIAEFCGLLKRKEGEIVEYQDSRGDGVVYQLVNFPDGSARPCYIENIPNYPQDLNVMWEAEEKLSDKQWLKYSGLLSDIIDTKSWDLPAHELKMVIHATAKQRAIAFVKTIREIKR